jgi:hypothetical protein
MEKVLSRIVRKPNSIDEKILKDAGWFEARERIMYHLQNDEVLRKLVRKFTMVDDHVKLIRSTNDMKINFHVLENSKGHRYAYARTQFILEGERKDFRKYLGREEDVDFKKVNLSQLKDYFLDMLKNYLEY